MQGMQLRSKGARQVGEACRGASREVSMCSEARSGECDWAAGLHYLVRNLLGKSELCCSFRLSASRAHTPRVQPWRTLWSRCMLRRQQHSITRIIHPTTIYAQCNSPTLKYVTPQKMQHGYSARHNHLFPRPPPPTPRLLMLRRRNAYLGKAAPEEKLALSSLVRVHNSWYY